MRVEKVLDQERRHDLDDEREPSPAGREQRRTQQQPGNERQPNTFNFAFAHERGIGNHDHRHGRTTTESTTRSGTVASSPKVGQVFERQRR